MVSSNPVILLHGFWHGTWCWSEVIAALAADGQPAVAVDMAGHGLQAARPTCLSRRPFDRAALATEVSPLADIDLDRAGAQLAAQIATIGGHRPVTVVAHSMGGTVLTRAIQLVPQLVAHAVYLAAFMPASDVSAAAYVPLPENAGELVGPSLVADPRTVGALRLDVASNDVGYRDQLRAAFYGDVDPAVAEAAVGLLTPDGPARISTGATTLTRDGWGGVPRTYVMCSRDMAIRPALQHKFVTDADAAYPDNPTSVVTVETAHSPFLSRPAHVAEIIAMVTAAE